MQHEKQRPGRKGLREDLSRYESALASGPETPELLFKMATALSRLGRYHWAVPYYRKVLALSPEEPHALYNLGTTLGRLGDFASAAEYYQRCIDIDPDMAEAWHGLGAVEARMGRSLAAVRHYQKALALNPRLEEAGRDLGALMRQCLPGWHVAMLNDADRNRAYRKAIEKAVSGGSGVLEIGSGSGLLAMMAARAGARWVATCEKEPLLAEKAKEIVAANGLQGVVKVLGKPSQGLRLGRDLPRKADVMVAEVFDAGLLGEQVIPAINHARRNLLTPGAKVIPQAAQIVAALAESAELVNKDRVNQNVEGFDLSAFNEFVQQGYFSAHLSQTEHRLLSNPFEVFDFDFQKDLAENGKALIKAPATSQGVCHAVAFWFRLNLDDEIQINNQPGGNSHWGQAVQLLPRPVRLDQGERLVLWCEYDHRGLFFEPRGVLPASVTVLGQGTEGAEAANGRRTMVAAA